MATVRTMIDWMAERQLALEELTAAAALERRIVEAIVHGRYTPSPEQRRRLCAVLGVGVDEVAWGHQAEVVHIQGHGPQFGRSP